MRLQGRIPDSAKNVAVELRIVTNWQKYIVYDLFIRLALKYKNVELNGLAFNPQSSDVHEVTAEFMRTEEVLTFRKNFRVTSNAAFFRHSMHHGSKVIKAFIEQDLPEDCDCERLFSTIKRIMGDHSKFADGLEYLERFSQQQE